jgi:hypothetical protein
MKIIYSLGDSPEGILFLHAIDIGVLYGGAVLDVRQTAWRRLLLKFICTLVDVPWKAGNK